MSDIGVVLFLANHIENPCSIEVNGEVKNIRDFYLREAERLLPTLTNPYAIDMLKEYIDKYRKRN